MSVITIRVTNKLLQEIDEGAKTMHVPRSQYIRQAIEFMNNEIKNKKRSQQLKKASLRVRNESMRINKEFSRIEDE